MSAPQESGTTRPRSTRATATGSEPEGDAVQTTIRFYSVNAEYGCFSNFSPHPIRLKGKTWADQRALFPGTKVRWDAR